MDYFPSPGTIDSCGYGYYGAAGPCVDPMPIHFTLGLGNTYQEYSVGQTITACIYATHQMICYEQAGLDSLGPCPAEAILLHHEMPLERANFSLWTNSQNGEAGLQWTSLQPGQYDWTICDLAGVVHWKGENTMAAAGREKLVMPEVDGLFLVKITNSRTGEAYCLKVPNLGY